MEQTETLFDVGSEQPLGPTLVEGQPKKTSLSTGKRSSRRKNPSKYYRAALRRLRKDQVRLMTVVGQLQAEHRQCFDIAAGCQRQTAEVLNHTLEKQSLHPAIECVTALADEIVGLFNKLQRAESPTVEEKLKLIEDELSVSLCLAQQKVSALEIKTICPQTEGELNPAQHTVFGHQSTEESELHGKISQVVQEGIVYRGKILRSAKVLVFRCEKDTQNPLNERNES